MYFIVTIGLLAFLFLVIAILRYRQKRLEKQSKCLLDEKVWYIRDSPSNAFDLEVYLGTHKIGVEIAIKARIIYRKAKFLDRIKNLFGEQEEFFIQQALVSYLPETLRLFKNASPVPQRIARLVGKSPKQTTLVQLSLIENRLDRIHDSLQKQRMGNFLANEDFLRQVTEKENSDLRLPDFLL